MLLTSYIIVTISLPRLFLRLRALWLGVCLPLVGMSWSLVAAGGADEKSTVGVVKVTRGVVAQEISFDGELRPFEEIALHSRVPGYLQSLPVDVGDRVKVGQLLAMIEVPELKDDLNRAEAMRRKVEQDVRKAEDEVARLTEEVKRAEAEIKRAEAAHVEMRSSLQRLMTVSKTQAGLVAQQELDVAQARERTGEAQVVAAKATQSAAVAAVKSAVSSVISAKDQVAVAESEVRKVRTLLDYSRITAPFAGVITKRYVDPGALIQGGTSSGAVPLVRLSQVEKLRLVFPVSLSFVSRIKVGDAVQVRVASAGRTLSSAVSRFAGRVESATRTMETEVDVPNADLSLIPGIYATVTLQFDRRDGALTVPVEAALRDKKGASVLVAKPDGTLEERTVTVGVETPTKLEITSGLAENELVVVGNRSQLKPGQKVTTKLIELPRHE